MDETRKNFFARMWGHHASGSPATGANSRNATILVVDDSRTIAIALQRILENDGYLTLAAFDGVEAVELARRYRPDLILMDIVMPRMNGFEATRTILGNELTQHTPIIVISGNDQQSDRIWGSRLGARGFLAKPIDRRELLAKVQETLMQTKREAILRERANTALGHSINPDKPV
jgi:twitching motility two-component system response regulator PilH